MRGPYAKPGPVGGTLIRQVIKLLDEAKVERPFKRKVIIAFSGGADSTAMAHLLIHYGRRVVKRSAIRLLHINHNWRGAESLADEKFACSCAKKWRIPIKVFRLKPPKPAKGQSLEDFARAERHRIFEKVTTRGEVILTAHHAEDLAETLLWRLFTGTSRTHGAGILIKSSTQVRPLLGIRKRELTDYLQEVGQSWQEDYTNHDLRFLRARIRHEVLPVVEAVFPRAVEHLSKMGISLQIGAKAAGQALRHETLDSLFAMLTRPRRSHWQAMQRLQESARRKSQIHLPQGWVLTRIRSSKNKGEKWVLERGTAV